MRFDSLEVELVSDGVVMADAGGPFGLVPRKLWEKVIAPDEQNRVPMALTCLLLRSRGKTIVVDTGLGTKLTQKEAQAWDLRRPQGSLLDGLARLGVLPGDVDLVLDTHLHWDHCGGNTVLDGGQVRAAFPNAEYWVQYLEWADALRPNERTRATYLPENYVPLWTAGRLRLLHGDTPATPEVRCVVTRGHTRGHQSILLEAGSWSGLFVADMTSFAVHMERLAWVTAYDVEPLETIDTKRQWQAWALERDVLLIFEHDTQVPLGRLVKEDGKVRVQRVGED